MKNFVSNFFYQSMFQIVKLLTPLITIPLVSHALGPTNIGIYNFTQSITQYFILLASLGMALYGQKTIAENREDILTLSKKFWELEILSVICTLVSLFFYFLLIFQSEYKILFIIQSLTIISVALDISWFFMGIEDFRLTSLRSMLITLITFLAIVFFVNDENDLITYVLIQSLGILLSQLLMWAFIHDKIIYSPPKLSRIFFNFQESLKYFIPQISIMLYTNLNKTLLGLFNTKTAVGYYSNAFIIIMVVRTIISTTDVVLLPKLSNLSSKNDKSSILRILNISLNYQLVLTVPAMFGIIMIAPNFVPWFFGSEFYPVIQLMQILSVLVVIVPAGMSISRQWLIPSGNLKAYNYSVLTGGILGVISNIILIPILGALGAVLSTVVSELFVSFVRIVSFVKETKFNYNYILIIKSFIASSLMFFTINKFFSNLSSTFLTTLIEVLSGFFIYILIMIFLNFKTLKNKKLKMFNKRI